MAEAKRKLAAILSADVAGFSRLMGQNDRATLEALKALRVTMTRYVEAHDGRVVNAPGDAILAEFTSAVEAVQAAAEIQASLAEQGADLPEDRRMRVRIGINLGDVLVEPDGTLYGDGVNIAARMEGLAEPGAICVSSKVVDEVEGKTDLSFQTIGKHEVKNIARPVHAYRVVSETAAPTASEEPAAIPDKPSIAVLPFDNMSGDPEQAYFSDGISEDIITDLSKISGLLVIARNSSFAYRGKSVSVPRMASELGVRYVVEGSVRRAGDRVRITAQLIDSSTGGHLWAERYDRDLTDIFAVQDEVTQQIVSALALNLTKDEQERLARRGTDHVEAYEYFLRGREQAWLHTRQGTAQARSLLERAIELDPGFAAAVAELAFTHVQDYVIRWSASPEQSLDLADDLARRAVALDDTESRAHRALALVHLWKRQHEEAIAEAERAIVLAPGSAEGYGILGHIVHYAGRSKESVALIDELMRLDPHYPDLWLHFLAQAHFALEQYAEAIDALRRRVSRRPDSDISHVLLAASYGHLGRRDEAQREWSEALRINPTYSLEDRRQVLPYRDPADFDRMVDGLRKAGLPE